MLRCNIWHVKGKTRDLFIDTGLGVASLREAARDLLDKPVSAVATHCHLDHVGGMHEFDCRLCHEAEATVLSKPDPSDLLIMGDDHWLSSYMPDLGNDRLVIDALPHSDFTPEEWTLKPAPATGFLADGDVLDLGDRHFEVLHLPGHSPGSIALWEPASATLFTGDVIYSEGDLLDQIPGACVSDYAKSLERLLSLPVHTVHAGHEDSFGRSKLHERIESFLSGWEKAA